jgi:prepilin-type N-terminal cleavage/methylation domain-containing protein
MRNFSREDGFTITEMMVATAVVLMVLAGALTTFKNALAINDSAGQLADANQNLRAGTNQLVRDLLMAGRIIGAAGISLPTGAGITYKRPGPVNLNFDMLADGDSTLQLPSISTGYQLGPMINGTKTDIITIMTVDEFMPVITTPPAAGGPGTATATEGTISADGTNVQLAANSLWLSAVAAKANDTPTIKVGDLVLYVGSNGNAIQTVTSVDATHIYFAQGDFFRFNQPNATVGQNRPLAWIKEPIAAAAPVGQAWQVNAPAAVPPTFSTTPVTLFKALMITYYVDNTTRPGTPRLTRVVNNCPASDPTCALPASAQFAPQALAGVVEDLDLTFDLYDGVVNPTRVTGLPYVLNGVTYTESQIRKVNVHVGVRSELISRPMQDYVRNHITTSVNVRSLAAVDKY